MGEKRTMESRHAVAARNVEAILDAAARLLVVGAPLSFSALATEAGVSRPTVYAHFADRPRLLAAVLERSVERTAAAMESADPDHGPPVEALRRLIAASWRHVADHHEIARSAVGAAAGAAVHGGHGDGAASLARLVERGRAEGAFRGDLPTAWLVAACLGLIHAAAGVLHAGQMEPDAVQGALTTSVVELCVQA